MSATAATREALALHGGTPVRRTLLPYGRQTIDEDDIQAVVDTLRSDWLTTGPKVNEFEEAFATWVGARYAVSFSSGTDRIARTHPRCKCFLKLIDLGKHLQRGWVRAMRSVSAVERLRCT